MSCAWNSTVRPLAAVTINFNVIGTVNIAGVTLQCLVGFTPTVGDEFILINNDAKDPVTGPFNGLPSGQFYLGSSLYQISYSFGGKPGNDVAIEMLNTPPPPTLTIEPVPPASVRLLWPVNNPPFSLQTATNLPATNWAAASFSPVVIGTNNVLTNSVSGGKQFFRLTSP